MDRGVIKWNVYLARSWIRSVQKECAPIAGSSSHKRSIVGRYRLLDIGHATTTRVTVAAKSSSTSVGIRPGTTDDRQQERRLHNGHGDSVARLIGISGGRRCRPPGLHVQHGCHGDQLIAQVFAQRFIRQMETLERDYVDRRVIAHARPIREGGDEACNATHQRHQAVSGFET